MQIQNKRALSLLLAALMLCLTILPAAAANSAKASTIQLAKTRGTVEVTNSSGRSLSTRNNMLLYNGYHTETKARSYAWINLDDTKLAKLDAVSKAEVRKSGRKLELLLNSGNLFFNVTSPLAGDETLNIRTSTMVVGVRGTSGWIKVVDRWCAEIYILEGAVQCDVTDPVTGQVKTATLHGGDKAIATAYPQDRAGDKCDILMQRYEAGDIDGFVLEELAQDPGLCGEIYEKTGLDVLNHMGLLDGVRRRLEAFRDELDSVRSRFERGDLSIGDAQARLDELRQQLEELRNTLEQAGPDDNARRRLEDAQEHLRQAQEALNNARPKDAADSLDSARADLELAQQAQADGAQQKGKQSAQDRLEQDEREMQDKLERIEEELDKQDNNVSSDPVWGKNPPSSSGGGSGGGSTTDPTVTLTMPQTATVVQGYLNNSGVTQVILLPSSIPDENILVVDIAMTVPTGKTLTLADEGISILVNGNAFSLTVNGTVTGAGTLVNDGLLTVNSSNTLQIQFLINNGVLKNAASGRIVTTLLATSGRLESAGTVEGKVIQLDGTAVISGGTVTKGYIVDATDGKPEFEITGGTITADGAALTSRGEGGTLRLTGGTLTGGGAGGALVLSGVERSVVMGGTTIQNR